MSFAHVLRQLTQEQKAPVALIVTAHYLQAVSEYYSVFPNLWTGRSHKTEHRLVWLLVLLGWYFMLRRSELLRADAPYPSPGVRARGGAEKNRLLVANAALPSFTLLCEKKAGIEKARERKNTKVTEKSDAEVALVNDVDTQSVAEAAASADK